MSDLQLMGAVKNGDLEAARNLIGTGTDVNARDDYGWTPLNQAAGKGDIEMVKLLLENGADPLNVGRDQRTPYMIAIAASHVDVARLLRESEDKLGDGKGGRPEREYCAAYHLEDLRKFPGWGQAADGERSVKGTSEDDIVFIQQDFTVTKSMWRNEDVIFDQVSDEWVEFCTNVLGFKVLDDIDLIVKAGAATAENA